MPRNDNEFLINISANFRQTNSEQAVARTHNIALPPWLRGSLARQDLIEGKRSGAPWKFRTFSSSHGGKP